MGVTDWFRVAFEIGIVSAVVAVGVTLGLAVVIIPIAWVAGFFKEETTHDPL